MEMETRVDRHASLAHACRLRMRHVSIHHILVVTDRNQSCSRSTRNLSCRHLERHMPLTISSYIHLFVLLLLVHKSNASTLD